MQSAPPDEPTFDTAPLHAYLAATSAELKRYIDPAHMSYLPFYLGRADVRHALGEPPEAVLRELAFAARVYASAGGIFLTKWPHAQFRRRRLEPLEVCLASGDEDALPGVRDHFTVDAFSLFAGLEHDALQDELAVATPWFRTSECETPIQAAGALGVFYWLSLSAALREDAEALALVRQRAGTFLDDFGHLLGGASAGPIARLRTVHECLQVIRAAPPPDAAAILARGVARHIQLSAAEYAQLEARDPEAFRLRRGSLDRTALALLALGRAFGIDLGELPAPQLPSPRWLAYAAALGHTVAP